VFLWHLRFENMSQFEEMNRVNVKFKQPLNVEEFNIKCQTHICAAI